MMKPYYCGNSFRQRIFAFLCLLVLNLAFPEYHVNAQSAENYDWGNVAIGGGGFVSAVIADPNTQGVFYARTDVGGAYRWDEATQSWIPLTDWVSETEIGLHGIDGIAVDPNVAGRVYLLAGTTYWNGGKSMFLRSDDYGDTWEQFEVTSQFKAHGNGMGRGNGERIAVDPNNSNIIFIGSRFDGMWKSTNRGSSWTQVTSYPVTTTANEAGTSIVVFDPSSASGGVSQTIYAGVGRANDNLYVSHDAGASWSLVAGRPTAAGIMPQRIASSGDGNTLYVTYGNGAGPHAQLWGGVTDYFNRGAIYKYDVPSGTWTDISPENYMLDLDKIEEGTSQVHYGAYSGISIDPTNENRILVTSINSWRGVQYWNDNGTWMDKYGDNIFLSEDGGQTWREMFRFYSTENGQLPDYDMVSTNGINWVKGSTVHWNSSVVIDPFNSDRAFVTCGNGVWGADNLSDSFTRTDSEGNTTEHGKATWKFKSHGIDETVPQDLVSVPGGPLISTILDYTGFSHNDITQYVPPHNPPAGSTTGLAVAAQNPAKVVRVGVEMHYSTDTAKTWTQTTINGEKGKLALSADGNVLLHSPQGSSVMYRSTDNGSTWSTVSGINTTSSFLQPVADPVNANKFYTYDPETGAVMRSTDGGASFSQASTVAIDGWRKLRAAPDREGDLWIALDSAGLVRSTNSGSSFSTISGITICRAVGFGKAASGASYPAVYIWGTINGVTGIHQSIDEGATWTRVNDDEHEYGGPANGEFVVGDMNVFGRVYMSTAGRGIVYGDPVACTPTAITPYVQINDGAWQQTASATLDAGGSVKFGPQPTTGGAWNWSGPNGYSATTREVTISNIQTGQAGDYIATYTNSSGCESTQTFTVTVTGGTGGGSGTILREYWTSISGSDISNLTSNANYPDSPTGSEQITSLEGPTNWANSYGTRIRGYIHPSTTGTYTFWVAGDNDTDLYLSTNDDPANATRIAYVDGWTNSREWSKYSTQQSASVTLTAGQKYYVEVLHKEGSGGDNLAVAWQGPGITQQVIDGSYLSPYDPSSSSGTIVVRALGTQGDETIDLRVDDVTVATWTLTTSYTEYTAAGSGAVTVHFTNDSGGRDVQIDYVTVNGVTYQSEDQATNTGVWTGTCGGSNSEWLHCNGYISYASASSSSARSGSTEFERSTETSSVLTDIAIYPNPAQEGKFTIALPEAMKMATVNIFDNQGRLLYERAMNGAGKMDIDSGLKAGVYLVKVKSEGSSFTKKLIVH